MGKDTAVTDPIRKLGEGELCGLTQKARVQQPHQMVAFPGWQVSSWDKILVKHTSCVQPQSWLQEFSYLLHIALAAATGTEIGLWGLEITTSLAKIQVNRHFRFIRLFHYNVINSSKWKVSQIVKHQDFLPLSSPGGDGRNDIALLVIRTREGRAMQFDHYVGPACLPGPGTKIKRL